MALTLTKIRDIEEAPGQPALKYYLVRFDDSYVDQGYALTASNFQLNTIQGASVMNCDAYIVLGCYPTDAATATVWRLTAVAPHTSQGTGGHQLNPGSTVLNNKLAVLLVWGY